MKKDNKKVKLGRRNVLSAISELAEATGRGFERIEKGLLNLKVEMDTRFDRVDKRLNDLQDQITRIESYILRDHQRRLETIEHRLHIER